MRGIALALAILMSTSLVGCQTVKSTYDKMKFWDRNGNSDSIEVTITNITPGMYLTPILAVGHGDEQGRMFEFESAASEPLQIVAEGGNLEPISQMFDANSDHVVKDPHGGLLGPGESTTFTINRNHTRLSLIAKILPTNDGFIAANDMLIREGSQELYAIDAGTEANNEQITGGAQPNTPGIPADPGGLADRNAPGIASAKAEGKVNRHPGISGAEGSALNPDIHGWNGPVAIMTIEMRN